MAGNSSNKPLAPGALDPEATPSSQEGPVASQSVRPTVRIPKVGENSTPQTSIRDTVPLPTTMLRMSADRAMEEGKSGVDDEGLRETTRINPADITGRTRSGTYDVTLGSVPRGEYDGMEVQKEAEGLGKYPVSYSLVSIPNPDGGTVDLSSLDEALAQDLRRFASDLQIVNSSPRVYGLVIRGERSVSRTVEVYKLISHLANELGLQTPSIVATAAKLSVKETGTMGQLPESLLRHKEVILKNHGVQVFDAAFAKACQDPREASYVNIKAKHRLTDELILATSFESRLKLIPGGSKHQYFRDREMGQAFDLLDRGLTSGRPQFLTLEAALQMGKSRMIHELTAKLRTKHPGMRDVFVPQKDHDANANLSYARAFTRVLLETTKDILMFNASKEYEYLAQFAEDSRRPVEINGLIKALTGYLSNTQSSGGISLFITPDDLHWIDPASTSVIGQVFSKKNFGSLVGVVGVFAGRNGDQPIPNILLNSLGVKSEERIFLDKIDLLDKHGNPVPEFKKFVLDLLGYDVTKASTMNVVLHDEVLLKLASLAHGNPGKITGAVNAMKEAGVLKNEASKVVVDTDRLSKWEDTGLAASAMVNKVDRHIEDPNKRAVLAYIVALSHIGGCTLSLLYELFEHGIKKPEYYDMALNLVSEEVLARSGDRDEKISIMEKDFADLFSQRMPSAEMQETYAHALVYLHKMREHFKDKVVIPQASAYNLYKCAEKADMAPYKKHYSLAAFEEAAQRRDYRVVLDIYDYVKADRGLLRTIEDKNAFYLNVLEAMQVVGGERYFGSKNGETFNAGEFELLAAQVRGGFESGFMQDGDLIPFEKFCDTIIAGYFRRSILQGLSEDSAKKIAEWSRYYSQCFQNFDAFMHQQGGELDAQEKKILEFKCLYNVNLSRLAFHAAKEAGSDFDSLVLGMERILSSDEGVLRDNPRFQMMYVQALRLLGVAYLNLGGSDIIELATKYGAQGHALSSFDDAFGLQQSAATSPESHAYRSYMQAFTQLEKFFAFLNDHPNVAIDDSTYNRGLQNAARASTWTGNYHRAWKYFSDMRTRANNSGDVTGFAAATKDASIMIAYLVRNLEQFSPKQNAELWNQAQELLKSLDLEYTGKNKTYTPAELMKGLVEYGRSFASKSVGVLRSRDAMAFQIVWANQIDLDLMKRNLSLQSGEKPPEILHHAYNGMDDVDALMNESWDASFYAVPILARYATALIEDMDRMNMPEEARDQIYMFIDKILHQYKITDREIDGKIQQLPTVVGRNPALLKALADIQQELYKMNREAMPEYVRLLKSKFDAVQGLLEAHMNPEEQVVLQS